MLLNVKVLNVIIFNAKVSFLYTVNYLLYTVQIAPHSQLSQLRCYCLQKVKLHQQRFFLNAFASLPGVISVVILVNLLQQQHRQYVKIVSGCKSFFVYSFLCVLKYFISLVGAQKNIVANIWPPNFPQAHNFTCKLPHINHRFVANKTVFANGVYPSSTAQSLCLSPPGVH